MIDGKSILVTGGTGSFGQSFALHILKNYNPKKIVILSRSELNQWKMKENFKKYENKMRYIVADIRDIDRLNIAFQGIDIIVHAAAMKQIDTVEYNPNEAILTNINGSMNVISAAIKNKVAKVIALNTDKSCAPINFYGATKFIMEKLFNFSHVYAQNHSINLSVVRYGNIIGSNGSVIEKYKNLISRNNTELPITDEKMTRFWTDLENHAIPLVVEAIKYSIGGDVFIPKCKSFYIKDLIKAFDCTSKNVGIREGEKLSEQLILPNEVCFDYELYYKVYPRYEFYVLQDKIKEFNEIRGLPHKKVEGFYYDSTLNNEIMTVEEIKRELKKL